MSAENEYTRGDDTLPPTVPRPVITPTGRPVLPMIKLLELAGQDTRMGRA